MGEATVDLQFERDEGGRTDYRVLDIRGTLHVIRQPSPWSLTAGVGERIRDVIESCFPAADWRSHDIAHVVVITAAAAGFWTAARRRRRA